MKLTFLIVFSSFCVFGQQLDNPFDLKNGLNVNNEYNYTLDYKTSFSNIADPNYGGMILNMNSDYSKSLAPLELSSFKRQKIDLTGFSEALFYLTRDILSGFAK